MTVVNPSTYGLVDHSHSHAVLSHLSEQRSEGLFCDVIIVVEDVKFHAHRNILAATSGYFQNAFKTAEVYSSSLVLELPDLRSEVFASILNFIYCARVESDSKEDKRSLVAAGKRLGIPFLEKLLDSEKQNSSLFQNQSSPWSRKFTNLSDFRDALKKEALKPEEVECAKGPRITNAFSMTDVGEINNPFSTVDHINKVTEEGPRPFNSLDTTKSTDECERGNALNEHSYAVCQMQESAEAVEGNGPRSISPTLPQSKAVNTQTLGPIKKLTLKNNSIPSLSKQVIKTYEKSTVVQPSLPEQSSDETKLIPSNLDHLKPLDDEPTQHEEPPCLSPQNTLDMPSFSCKQCPETFTDSTQLTIHIQKHKRTIRHLFCKFCNKKFLHLKRLRNHEQICVKSLKGPSESETTNKDSRRVTVYNDASNEDDAQPSLPSADPNIPLSLNHMLNSPPEMSKEQVNGSLKANSTSRSYKCSVCKRAYVTISSLKRHENVHSWQRAYPCHYCNKVFALAEYRTKHEIWHTGERRYQCIFCLETFLTYYILRNHQKSYHGIDPQMTVKKKSANGGLKSSVYPMKLYRLLPMTFRKKIYKSYSRTYSEGLEGSEESFGAPMGSTSPNDLFESSVSLNNPDVVSGQSLFSMPVTFMATPKMMASETPRISIEKPCALNERFPIPELKQPLKRLKKSGSDGKNTSLFRLGFADSSKAILNSLSGSDYSTQKNKDSSSEIIPFLNIPSVCSFEGLSKLSELSAAAQTIEDMANQLLQARPESIAPDKPASGKTETYIAKPACPGPSPDNQVLPLCQITVKIGDEAVVRRKIKGSTLLPKKKKRKCWRLESTDQTDLEEDSIRSPNLRLRAEVTTSVTANDTNDDPETDMLWRPYYTYKPKKRGKKPKDKRGRRKHMRSHARSVSPKANEDITETPFFPDKRISADNYGFRGESNHSSKKQAFPCHSCEGSFSTQTSLSMHIISCHQPHCRICGKQCSPEDTSSTAGPTAENGCDLICKDCMEDGSCFSSVVASQSLSMEKRYRCSYCPQRFLYLATKKSHEKKHLEKSGNALNCRHCAKICKSTLQLSMHESKHFRAEDGKDSATTGKISKLFPTENDYQGQIQPDPWESVYSYSEVKTKISEPNDFEYKGNYSSLSDVYKKTSLSLSHAADSPYAYLSPEIKRKSSKKKNTFESSKRFGFDGHRHGSLEKDQQE